jgi:hypothetical protein
MNFTLSNRARSITFGLMGLGALATVVGVLGDHTDHHQRTAGPACSSTASSSSASPWARVLLRAAERHRDRWTVLVKRVYEGIYSYLPIGAVVMVVVLAAGSMHLHHLYHWMDHRFTTSTWWVKGTMRSTWMKRARCCGQSELRCADRQQEGLPEPAVLLDPHVMYFGCSSSSPVGSASRACRWTRRRARA